MLHKNVLQHIFNEGVYQVDSNKAPVNPEKHEGLLIEGNSQSDVICVLLSKTKAQQAELELLQNILKAIGIKKDEYGFIDRWSNNMAENYKHVFIFGGDKVDSLDIYPMNQFHQGHNNVFKTFGLNELMMNQEFKRRLWQAISAFKR